MRVQAARRAGSWPTAQMPTFATSRMASDPRRSNKLHNLGQPISACLHPQSPAVLRHASQQLEGCAQQAGCSSDVSCNWQLIMFCSQPILAV